MRGLICRNPVRRRRKGSATLEFITVLPLVLLMSLFVWQFAVVGMAVMETQALVKEGVRLAARSGNPEKEERRGMKEFSASGDYRLLSYRVKIEDGQAVATARTEIDTVFLPLPPLEYSASAKAPVIE